MSRLPTVPTLVLALTVASGAALAAEPDYVVVQHVLISFKGRIDGKDITRTKKEAKALAEELLARAEDGEDFGALVEQYTDDRPPGIYKMSNRGVAKPVDGLKREEMVPRFGDVAFRLEVGEVGMATYNSMTSPYGWHIIKRLE